MVVAEPRVELGNVQDIDAPGAFFRSKSQPGKAAAVQTGFSAAAF